MLSHAAYMAMAERKSVLTQLPGWRLCRVQNDSMHCVNLGLAWLLIGNVLWCLVCMHAFLVLGPAFGISLPVDASADTVLADFYIRFKLWLRRHKLACTTHRFTKANLHISSNGIFYKCKASKSPIIISWLASVTFEFARLCQPEHKDLADAMAVACWALSEYFSLLKLGGRLFTHEEATKLDHVGHAFMYSYAECMRLREDHRQFHMPPKIHQFNHIILDSVEERTNPRFSWCFGGEDMIGKMLLLARAGHALTVVANSIDTYVIGLIERLKNFRRWRQV
jgi:hypothetical protein